MDLALTDGLFSWVGRGMKLFGAFILSFSVVCAAQGEEKNKEREGTAAMVENYVCENFPDFSPEGWILDLIERDDVLVFFYRASDDVRGGGPVVIVKKGSNEVLDSYREQ